MTARGHVLDTSALLALIRDEPGSEEVLRVLGDGLSGEVHEPPPEADLGPSPVLLPFMALMELEHIVRQRAGPYEADRAISMVRCWPVEVVESGERWRREAARLKASYRLSLADAWIAALAVLRAARLVHRDPEYDLVEELECLRLPER